MERIGAMHAEPDRPHRVSAGADYATSVASYDRALERIATAHGAGAGLLYGRPRHGRAWAARFALDLGLAMDLGQRILERVGSAGEGKVGVVALDADDPAATALAACVGTRGCRAVLALLGDAVVRGSRESTELVIAAEHLALALEAEQRVKRRRRRTQQLSVELEQAEVLRAALEEHSRELESSLVRRTRLLAALSHELRTPLNAMMGYVHLLQRGAYGPLGENQSSVADRISASAGQVVAMLEDILNLARIDGGGLDLRRVETELSELVAEVVSMIEPSATEKGLALEISAPAVPVRAWTDPVRVKQILLNLLSNAVKFTPSGRVAVRLEARERPTPNELAAPDPTMPAPDRGATPPDPPNAAPEDRWIGVSVEDTGPGIPPDQLEAVFEEFVQLDVPGADPAPGSGLGLAISRSLARRLGGELVARSTVGEYSRFTLLLPVARQNPGTGREHGVE